MNWWCEYWRRPLKDPLLQTYTIEELAYEFYSVQENKKAAQERIEAETDKIEEAKEQAAFDWAAQAEAEEAEEEARREALKKKPTADSVIQDPENIKWMQEQIDKEKAKWGDDFGEDLNLNFDET